MASTPHRPISPPAKSTALLLLLLLLFLLLSSPAAAQPPAARPPPNSDDPYTSSVSPALAILVVAVVSAFFLLGFFSIYLRRCAGDRSAVAPAVLGGVRSRRGGQRGLDPSLLASFPTMGYSSVKAQKLGKESLECAVCLCEFDDEDLLRLLPRCSHVFHRDCIDIWLGTHASCPVCRRDLAAGEEERRPEAEERDPDLEDLVRIGSRRREEGSSAGKRRSPEDWAAVVGGGGERFRLRLPEEVEREVFAAAAAAAAAELRRSASSFAVFGRRGEGSGRRGYREGGWRSLRMGGRSGRWAAILGRSLSARGPPAVPEGAVSGKKVAPEKVIDGGVASSSSAFDLV